MRLAVYQGPSPSGDMVAAFAEIDRTLATAAAAGAQMAVMPELYLPGYNADPMTTDSAWRERLAALAARHGVGLTIGVAEMNGDVRENVALALGPDGALLARYSKEMLFGPREKSLFECGTARVAFDFAGHRIGLLICYDVEFPELVRAHARDGVDLLLVPTGNPEPYDTVCRFVIPATAAQHSLSIAYANYCGPEGDVTYCGRSVIAGPDGEPLATAGLHPTILIADIPRADDPALRPLNTQLEDLDAK